MTEIQSASHSRNGAEPHSARGRTSPLFVRVMICLTAVLTLGMISLVFYRSQSIVEPTAAVLVIGDPSLDGARVAVLSNRREVVAATLSGANGFTTSILLQPGLYELEVAVHGRVLLHDHFNVQSLKYATFSLPTAIMVQGDPSMPGARVQIIGESGNRTVTDLGAENNYTAIGYYLPGTYHVTVTRDERSIKNETLTLVAHRPRRISLATRSDTPGFSD